MRQKNSGCFGPANTFYTVINEGFTKNTFLPDGITGLLRNFAAISVTKAFESIFSIFMQDSGNIFFGR